MRSIYLLVFVAWCGAVSPAWAETLRVEGVYPAGSDAAAALRTITVEQFGGEGGADLSFRIEDTLRAESFRGQPWIRVMPYGPNSAAAPLMRGTAAIDEQVNNYSEQRERCIKGADGKCTDAKEKFQVQCKRRVIELQPRIRLVAPDGTLLWSDDRPEQVTETWCDDSGKAPRQRGAIARDLADRVARRTRAEFVPGFQQEDVRVDENRKELNKADGDSFKAAVRKVKDGNAAGACADWTGLAAANPAHLPSLFNLGVCAEAAGNDAAAQERYQAVLQLDPRNLKAQGRLGRIAERQRARRQLEAHAAG